MLQKLFVMYLVGCFIASLFDRFLAIILNYYTNMKAVVRSFSFIVCRLIAVC